MTRGTIATTLTALLLTGCSGNFQPDMPGVEGQIRDDLAEQLDINPDRLTLDCPSTIDWRPGDEFRCFAEDKRGNRRQVVVHMENDKGEITWELQS